MAISSICLYWLHERLTGLWTIDWAVISRPFPPLHFPRLSSTLPVLDTHIQCFMEMLDVCSMFLGTPGVSPLETDFISVIWERLESRKHRGL
jgi:hypothetical protein